MLRPLCVFVIALFCCACSAKPLPIWDRDLLAKPEMQLSHPFDSVYEDHLYFSKEASSGGQGFAAGGCGCN